MKKKQFTKPDIATIEELSAKLIIANNKLKESEKARLAMLENISHDLRAPITAIRSSVDYLTDCKDVDSDMYKKILNLLDSRTRTLEALINDLYYLISLDNPQKKFNFSEIPLEDFLTEYFYSNELDSKYNQRRLVFEVPEHFPYIVKIDCLLMTRVLDNLFTNALKYSHDNDNITLGAYEKENYAYFYVKDSGIGIPSESVSKVFERSYTVSDSRSPKSVTGSGLGLSIVYSIIEHHNGNITCESVLGKGSCFTVKLPISY